jgi:hypothetical protein
MDHRSPQSSSRVLVHGVEEPGVPSDEAFGGRCQGRHEGLVGGGRELVWHGHDFRKCVLNLPRTRHGTPSLASANPRPQGSATQSRTFAELLIDLEEAKAARTVVFRLLMEMERR